MRQPILMKDITGRAALILHQPVTATGILHSLVIKETSARVLEVWLGASRTFDGVTPTSIYRSLCRA